MKNQNRIYLSASGIQRVDRENRIIYGVSLATIGEARGHRVLLDSTTINQIVTLGQQSANGIKCRWNHTDEPGRLLGRIKSIRRDGDKALGDLHLSKTAFNTPNGNLGDYILDLAENEPDMFGMSIDVLHSRITDPKSPLPVMRVARFLACDVVDDPAANRDGLFSAQEELETMETEELQEQQPQQPAAAAQPLSKAQLAASAQVLATKLPKPLQDHVAWEINQGHLTTLESISDRIEYLAEAQFNVVKSQMQQPADPWGQAIAQRAARQLIAMSGLPAATRERLSAGSYASPEAVDAAIEAERGYLAKLSEGRTIRGITPITEGMMTNELDKLQLTANWVLGDRQAPAPTPNMRSLRDMYLALTGDYDFHGRFYAERSQLAAADTTTLPGVVVNAMNRIFLQYYSAISDYRWYERIVSVQPNDMTSQPMQWITFGGISDLPIVAEGAPYTEASVVDMRETSNFYKRGKYVGITLEMIRRNNIAQVQLIPRELLNTTIRTRSNAIAGIFTQASGVGPTLSYDSTVLFHANHGNIRTTALSYAEWSAVRTAVFKQSVPGSSKRLGVWPKYALVPIDLYDTALQTFGYGSGDQGAPGTSASNPSNAVNAFGIDTSHDGLIDPRPVPLVVPEWTDTNDWAAIADPNLQPVIQMSYMQQPNGGAHPMPEVFTAADASSGLMFTSDVLAVKVRDWFAYGVSTYLGIHKSNV